MTERTKRKYTLSAPLPRTELIKQFDAARLAASSFTTPDTADTDATITCPACAGSGKNPDGTACTTCKGAGNVPKVAPKPAAEAAPVDPTKPADPADPSADTEVSSGAADLQAAIEKLQKEQATDGDDSTDPNDVKVTDILNQMDALAKQLAKAQGTDVAEDKPDSPPPHMNPVAAASPTADAQDGPINPVDEEGNVDDDATCATNGCGHMGSAHADTETGANTGGCSMCDCPQMTFATNVGDEIAGDDAPSPGEIGDTSSKLGALFAVPDAPPAAPPSSPTIAPADSSVNEAPTVPGNDVAGPAFVIPCGIIEGQETDDGRSIAANALTWLNPPLPLMGQATGTHDPTGMDMNAPSVLCGRIDSITRTAGENGTQIISAKGVFLSDEDGLYYADKVADMGRIGISADVKVFETSITAGELDEYGFPENMTEVVTSGEVAGFTIVPNPAFPQCYIKLDDGAPEKPIPVQSGEDSAMAASQLVHFMVTEPCLPCAISDVLEEAEGIRASGALVDVPMRPPKAWFDNPHFTVGDGRLVEIFTGRGEQRLGGKYACPLTVTDEGQVFGHIAPWDVCHTGYKGRCVTAPHSNMNYAQFMRAGQQVKTAEGDKVTVGVLTFDTGHADLSGKLRNSDVMRHYDHTGTAWADVVAGEDEHGIWVAGALRPNITELQLRSILASSPSGDWRECGGNLELMAVLNVNQPGFPVAMVAGGSTKALVSAGAATMWRLANPIDEQFTEEDQSKIMALAAKPMLRLVMADSRARLDSFVKQQADEARERLARL